MGISSNFLLYCSFVCEFTYDTIGSVLFQLAAKPPLRIITKYRALREHRDAHIGDSGARPQKTHLLQSEIHSNNWYIRMYIFAKIANIA